jgi:hypothetical protein
MSTFTSIYMHSNYLSVIECNVQDVWIFPCEMSMSHRPKKLWEPIVERIIH